ncbi:IS21 family transposase [Heliobacterium mobile]|nr:IS21 family transposase [Heliobacterium mobile]
MAQYYDIQRMHFREGKSIRTIAKELKMSRRTVKKYLTEGKEPLRPPTRRSIKPRPAPVIEEVRPLIEKWIREDENAPVKQRHTGKRIFERLVTEHCFTGAESTVRREVGRIRKKVKEVYLPLEFQLGDNIQCDWGQAQITLNGTPKTVHLFVMRLTASRTIYVRAYIHERQEAFFDGHCRAFEFFGGVPRRVTYDNLKTAVKKVLHGRNREENEAFQALRAHYVFHAEFCNVASGNEKGQVESMVGFIRRNFMVPVPEVQSIEEFNQYLEQKCREYAAKTRVPYRNEIVNELWEEEKKHLLAIPKTPFDACRIVSVKVSSQALVQLDTNFYSVPCRYVGEVLLLKAYVDHVIVVDQDTVVAEHSRCYQKNRRRLQLEHYIDALMKKPRALKNAAVFQTNTIPSIYRRFYKEMNQRYGTDGDKSFVRILYLHREHGSDVLIPILKEAERQGQYRYEVVWNLLHQRLHGHNTTQPMPKEALTERLSEYQVSQPDIHQFNQLLGKGGTLH